MGVTGHPSGLKGPDPSTILTFSPYPGVVCGALLNQGYAWLGQRGDLVCDCWRVPVAGGELLRHAFEKSIGTKRRASNASIAVASTG
jgi:hypothetical protein